MSLKLWREAPGKNWYVRGAAGGVRLRKSTRTPKRDLAESLRIQWESELDNRRVYGAPIVATFAEAVNAYLDAGGEGRFLLPLLEHFGTDKLLRDLDQVALDAAARALYPNAKPSTLNRNIYTPFIAVMTRASKSKLCDRQDWERPRGHNKRSKFRWLWPDEFEAVWQAAPPHGRVLLDMFAGTGLREAEGLTLTFDETRLQLAQAWIWEPKNDDPRRVEFPARAVRSIETVLHRDGPIILNGGGAPYVLQPDGGGALKSCLRSWANDANVEPFGAHVLRHTFATWFYSQTKDVIGLMAAGGWKSIDMVKRYAHLAPRGLDEELKRHGWDFNAVNHWQGSDKSAPSSEIISFKTAR